MGTELPRDTPTGMGVCHPQDTDGDGCLPPWVTPMGTGACHPPDTLAGTGLCHPVTPQWVPVTLTGSITLGHPNGDSNMSPL